MAQLFFGIGRCNINPTMPCGLAGYFNLRMWNRILDDLEVRALAIKCGGHAAFFVQFDLVTVTEGIYRRVMELLADLPEVGPENLLVTATHTHTAPEIRIGYEGTSPEYAEFIANRAADSLREAVGKLEEGELLIGLTQEHRFIFNRRYWMRNGMVITNPGKMNPDILRPEGEIDPEIPLVALAKDGRIHVLMANIVNHADTIGGNGVSADWPGFTRRMVESRIGRKAMVMPLIGCSGNINHFDVGSDRMQTCYEEARRIGGGYAKAIFKALPSLKRVETPCLRNMHAEVIVSPRMVTPEELAEAEATMAKYPEIQIEGMSPSDLTSEDLAKGTPFALKYFAAKLIERSRATEELTYHLTGFDFGPAVIASLPQEPFTEIGLALRKNIFAGKIAMAVSHSNGTGNLDNTGGYIPNAWNYGRGGYETTPRSNATEMATADVILNAWRSAAAKGTTSGKGVRK